ncbi:MarR family transcriptional regulator [Gryllotalpicola protaetiae]|uniref:arsenate reductase/protein-tyrosine-phosphatase family protein n=1 Tax=Gryllotalpicola protaetiae TaxID=2419771 RepID=UPI00319E078A
MDALSLGDRTPVELQAELGMPSNLMAHHLKTLEAAGLISRHRSEADRRRSYVTLERDGLAGLLQGDQLTAPRVVFVCTANTARSHLAAALWRTRSEIPSTSAGTHPGERIAPGALQVARRHGLELPEVAPRALADVAQPSDLVITVCDLAHEELAEPAALHLSVPDPVVLGTRKAFDRAFELLAQRIEDLAPRISSSRRMRTPQRNA